LHKPRHSVAWPLPHDELIVSPKMTSFMRGAAQPGRKSTSGNC
jgi:hypothetical protein